MALKDVINGNVQRKWRTAFVSTPKTAASVRPLTMVEVMKDAGLVVGYL